MTTLNLENMSLEDILATFVRTFGDNPRDLYGYIYKNGRRYKPAPKPDFIPSGDLGYCFDNALEIYHQFGYAYVEGYALSAKISALPIHHAWNVTPDGVVIDNTWNPVGLDYYGIEVEIEPGAREAWTTPLGVLVG